MNIVSLKSDPQLSEKPARASRDFSPRMGKGGVLTPPLQDAFRFSAFLAPRAACFHKLRGARDEQKVGSRFAAGLKPRPSDRPTEKGSAR
jgi:hypothetical protein